MVRLREHYGKEVVSALMKRFGYSNRMQVPRLEKIILNVGLGEATQDARMPVGCMVTLRRERMYEFFDRLVNAALPQIRDFRGVSPKAFDGRGNYSLGIREQFIFPEIEYDKVEKVHGMDVVIVTTARTNEEGKTLLSEMGMPFRS
ncbi:MAG: 50S ribosomal protein L5 [Nitrospirae bacterium]|nr:50S ribosomal protein L5 [Nitrospirota bacterium]